MKYAELSRSDFVRLSTPALETHCSENSKQIFPEMKLRGHVSNYYIQVSVSRKIGGPIVKLNNSLTDTRMWKLGTRPCSVISGSICFEFSLQCICSARL
jgi:hypothetical protein